MAIGRGFSDEDEEEVTRLSDPKDKSKEASQGPSKRRRQEKSQKSNASFGTVSGSPAKGTVEITKSNSYGHAGPNKRRPEKSQKSSASFDTVSSIPGKGSVEITKSNSFANNYGLRAKDKSNMAIERGFSDEDEEEVTRLSDPKDLKEASQEDKITKEALAKAMSQRKASAHTAAPQTVIVPTPALENAAASTPTAESAPTLTLARAIH